jgi:xanthine dehydrogenase YagR molybdenum-binding subunit
MTEKFHTVGRSAWRKDGLAKVTGAEKYTSDISLPRMWHARVLRSPHPMRGSSVSIPAPPRQWARSA